MNIIMNSLFKYISKQKGVSELEKIKCYGEEKGKILFAYKNKMYNVSFEYNRIHYSDYIKRTTKELFETDQCINFTSLDDMQDYVYKLFETKREYKQMTLFDL